MNILGINAYHGDASAALVVDGQLIHAVQEERFLRIKHAAGFPENAIRSCLAYANLTPADIDAFAVSRDPKAHVVRKAAFALTRRPSFGFLRDRLHHIGTVRDLPSTIAERFQLDPNHVRDRLHQVEHHPAHLASAFFVSPFHEAAVCAVDGFGDFVSTSLAHGRGNQLDVIDRIFFPHSLGLLYLAITQYLGFRHYGDEFKVMGLSSYGDAAFADEIRKLVRLDSSGGFQLDLSYFLHATDGISMHWGEGAPEIGDVFSPRLESLLGPRRLPDDPIEPRHEAIAASLQVVFEESAFHVLRALHERVRLPRLCLAGGCAMNSVANGRITARTPFREVFIQPASGDDGTALGAAFHVWNESMGRERGFVMTHANWGSEFSREDIATVIASYDDALEARHCRVCEFESEDARCAWAAAKLADAQVLGWFQGRMEWGARALGARCILADPRRSDMRDILNLRIKHREKFRPFAPSVLEEHIAEYFVDASPDPFMTRVFQVRPERRADIPAVTHVDGTGRLQSVNRATNPGFWRLIDTFRQLTGVPMLLNTSFNENEPIVHRPNEALDCFLRTRMDALVLGPFAIERTVVEA